MRKFIFFVFIFFMNGLGIVWSAQEKKINRSNEFICCSQPNADFVDLSRLKDNVGTETNNKSCKKIKIKTPKGYHLVWQDEFVCLSAHKNTVMLPDSGKWWFETAKKGRWNNELQRYIPGFENGDTCALVSNGTLKIIAKKRGDEVLSIRMNSKESWKYGYFEARLKFPQGRGTWPAFWMLPENFMAWPDDGEIDIVEEVGYRPNWVRASLHCKAYNHKIGTHKTQEKYIPTAESEFHVYAIEWTENFIKAFVDGENYLTFYNDGKNNKSTWPYNVPFYLKLNLAWGGDWGGSQGVDETKLPATFEIDYVRVFQKQK